MSNCVDVHVHSCFSPDSKQALDEIIETAIIKKCSVICLTDHFSVFPNQPDLQYFQCDEYFQAIHTLQTRYPQIKILCGLEFGEPHIHKDAVQAIINNQPWDFIIGSLHIINGSGVRKRMLDGENAHDVILLYLEELKQLALNADYDVIGHLDLFQRYVYDKIGIYDFNRYKEKIHDILAIVIERNKGIEINVSMYKKHQVWLPRAEILSMYHEMNGSIITVGSDAHFAKNVCAYHKEAYQLLYEIGFRYIYCFEKRKPIAYEIEKLLCED